MTAAFTRSGIYEAIVLDGYETTRGDNGTLDVICDVCQVWAWCDLKGVNRDEHLGWAAEHSEKHADVLAGAR